MAQARIDIPRDRIAEFCRKNHIQRLSLFGSVLRDDFRPDSDVDLLIVKPSSEPPHRRLGPAYQALWGIRVPIDVLWYTPEEVADWSTISCHVVTRAAREGRVLYEQDEP